jgi:hypothetical protein
MLKHDDDDDDDDGGYIPLTICTYTYNIMEGYTPQCNTETWATFFFEAYYYNNTLSYGHIMPYGLM